MCALSKPPHPIPKPPSDQEKKSYLAFSGALLLAAFALAFPETPPQALLGILWTGAGLLILLFPPLIRIPRIWYILAAGFIVGSAVGFLPREWFHAAPWRTNVEALGLVTGDSAFLQARMAGEKWIEFAVTAVFVIYLLGHRVGSGFHHRLVLGFALFTGFWTAVAIGLHRPDEVFGFFPNRNHTATLLAMGSFASLASLTHAIHLKSGWKIGISAAPLGLCLYALLAISESRAGIVLLVAGFVIWAMMMERHHLRGNIGKAIILLIFALIGAFLIGDSRVKSRLSDTVEQFENSRPALNPEINFTTDDNKHEPREPTMDGRVAIYLDTCKMIANESWTGVGPGQFSQVFPQYREKITASNDSKCYHPESDWLTMLTETGWPATLCLGAGLIAVLAAACKQLRRARSRFLKTGTLVAALILCLHGIIDVPGHRIGLAWSAALLLAWSLRPVAEKNHGETRTSGANRLGWRLIGAVPFIGGLMLVAAQIQSKALLPSAEVSELISEAQALYRADQAAYDRAQSEGKNYEPKKTEDPLELAAQKIKHAILITPLEPQLHYFQGVVALHFDDKSTVAHQSFAIGRLLAPTNIKLVLDQANAWRVQNPKETQDLWKEALNRAAAETTKFPTSQNNLVNSYQAILRMAGRDQSLSKLALEAADNQTNLITLWAKAAPVALLDLEMPQSIAKSIDPIKKRQLFQSWQAKGTKHAVEAFCQKHPEILIPPQ